MCPQSLCTTRSTSDAQHHRSASYKTTRIAGGRLATWFFPWKTNSGDIVYATCKTYPGTFRSASGSSRQTLISADFYDDPELPQIENTNLRESTHISSNGMYTITHVYLCSNMHIYIYIYIYTHLCIWSSFLQASALNMVVYMHTQNDRKASRNR